MLGTYMYDYLCVCVPCYGHLCTHDKLAGVCSCRPCAVSCIVFFLRTCAVSQQTITDPLSGAVYNKASILIQGKVIDTRCVTDTQGRRSRFLQGVWSLRRRTADEHDAFLVLTFVAETRLLAINEADELDEACIAGFDAAAHSLYCGNTDSDQLVQVRLCFCVSAGDGDQDM